LQQAAGPPGGGQFIMTQPVGQTALEAAPSVVAAGDAVSVAGTALASVVGAAGAAASVVVVAGADASAVVVVVGGVVLSPLQPATKIRTVNSNSSFFMMYSLWWLKKNGVLSGEWRQRLPHQSSLNLA
jgi:hypothetical protein